jgi:hypothetical protein
MQISTPPMSLRERSTAPPTQPGDTGSFLKNHPITEIIRGLVLSSVLWFLLAIGVYAVYTMVLGSN